VPEIVNLDLDIEGMTCTACARRIEKNLNKLPGVSAYVDFASERAHLTTSAEVTREQLVQVIEETGYSVGSDHSELDAMRARLWVGGAIATPVAIISMIPGIMDALMQFHWPWIAAAVTLPVASWVAWPFHSAAFKNLKQRATTMDTLVSLGVIIAYLYSAIQLVTGGMETYFEVAAVVPTVVLFGRWLEVRTRRSATDSVRALLAAIPDEAVVRRDGVQLTIATSQVKVGDVVVVASGQKIPVDAVVFEGAGQLDNSLITGESVPESVAAGDAVAAGAVNVGGALVLTASAVSGNSRIAKIADLVREASAQKAKISSLTDRISSVFVPAVIGLSVLTYLLWAFVAGDAATGLRAAIAVLVIACPCALGIAVPVSLAVATALGANRGIVIRHPDTLSLLNRINRVVLDKTGTVTTGQLRVTAVVPVGAADVVATVSQERAVALAAAVERGSVHPIAKAIAALDASLTAEDVSESAGSGVIGTVDGVRVEVSRRDAASFGNATELTRAIAEVGAKSLAIVSIDNRAILVLGLEDDIRETAAAAIQNLTRMGVEPILLSGDVEARVAAVAQQVGIKRYFAGVTPEHKLKTIRALKAEDAAHLVAMVGDGLNDVAALAGADVGIAMGSGTHATQSAAAITILDDDPQAIGFAIGLGRHTWSNIKQNLGWAFGYNVLLIPVAALGFLNPMLAGSAMAFSSISVVLNALRLRRVSQR